MVGSTHNNSQKYQ